jgi:sporulation protein YlmC with PRC-barrel domain
MIARLVGATCALLLLAGGIALSADKTRAVVAAAVRNHQFTALKGMTVENNDGEHLGTLTDFVLDMSSGRVQFGIITSGGIGPFAKQKIVPGFCLSLSSIKRHTLALDVNDTRWSKAPVFEAKHLDDLTNPARKQQIAGFYHFTGDIGNKEMYSVTTLSPTSRPNAADPRKAETLVLASDLLRRDVLDPHKESMGKISDVLIDTTQRKDTFVIFSSGGFLKRGSSYAVPLSDLQKTDHKTQLILPGPIDLAAAPLFEWSAPSPAGIYRYDVKQRP